MTEDGIKSRYVEIIALESNVLVLNSLSQQNNAMDVEGKKSKRRS